MCRPKHKQREAPLLPTPFGYKNKNSETTPLFSESKIDNQKSCGLRSLRLVLTIIKTIIGILFREYSISMPTSAGLGIIVNLMLKLISGETQTESSTAAKPSILSNVISTVSNVAINGPTCTFDIIAAKNGLKQHRKNRANSKSKITARALSLTARLINVLTLLFSLVENILIFTDTTVPSEFKLTKGILLTTSTSLETTGTTIDCNMSDTVKYALGSASMALLYIMPIICKNIIFQSPFARLAYSGITLCGSVFAAAYSPIKNMISRCCCKITKADSSSENTSGKLGSQRNIALNAV